ncbi:hypothetical protein D9615_001241 [Tricholomella constricta]|uniref:Ubiquitin-like domain-containing protein n=1 Tax=Tricholomella constricta TaxID=117010 RepID=A0A8H5HKW4_9AGAR|nr:hypothetical protein D9615_001241 [Tricholomella constricta]
MNGVSVTHSQNATTTKAAKPSPAGPTPPAPATAPPTPPVHINTTHPPPANRPNPPHNHTPGTNGHHHHAQKGKKRSDVPVDPATMYESLKNRIAALEEEEVLEEEEERRFAEEAVKSVKGMEEAAIHSKYIELFAELKRVERDHAKEKQKLLKDKDAGELYCTSSKPSFHKFISIPFKAKGQLTKANQTKTRMENLARELQKDNKRLREDGKRLVQSVEEAQDELMQMKNDLAKRADKAKLQDVKYREMPDIVVKVVCRYRAELFFKISRKTKLSRLFNAWTERMERPTSGKKGSDGASGNQMNGSAKSEAASTQPSGSTVTSPTMQFIFTHNGRSVEAEQTPEEAGMEDGDEILAVEMMDLTDGPGPEEWSEHAEPRREKLRKNWNDSPKEAKRTLEEIFDGVVRERLKEVLRQYELREKHFECVIRSKELEVLLSRARAAEQKQLAEGEKVRADKQEDENQQLRKDLEDAQNGQTMLIDKLITCCKEIIQKPNAERTQRLFASLREELERKGPRGTKKLGDGPVGG